MREVEPPVASLAGRDALASIDTCAAIPAEPQARSAARLSPPSVAPAAARPDRPIAPRRAPWQPRCNSPAPGTVLALFSYGFRPFFLGGGGAGGPAGRRLGPWLLGLVQVPSALPPVAWHQHELLFGFVPAVMAGFLLTAVPNWTGRLPVVGRPLIGLVALWIVGRVTLLVSLHLPAAAVALASLAFPIALVAVLAREILAGGNRRNLKVLVGVALLAIAQAFFHENSPEAARC